MATFIAFLRAVNIGKRQVKMAALRAELEANDFTDVATFIASGNVRVTTSMRAAAKVEKELERVMEALLGFDVPTMVRTPKQLVAAYEAGAELKSPVPGSPRRYVSFLKDTPSAAAVKELEAWDKPKERAQVIGREAHLWLGSDRVVLSNTTMEKILGTAGTARNWKTVTTLATSWG
jgi:uncharacterized protein (DUF1697 family)